MPGYLDKRYVDMQVLVSWTRVKPVSKDVAIESCRDKVLFLLAEGDVGDLSVGRVMHGPAPGADDVAEVSAFMLMNLY